MIFLRSFETITAIGKELFSRQEETTCHPEERSDEGSQNGEAIKRSEILRLRLR